MKPPSYHSFPLSFYPGRIPPNRLLSSVPKSAPYFFRNSSATKAQRRGMNYKTLSKREESIAENCRCSTYRLLKIALKELYYNLSVSVSLWLNYSLKSFRLWILCNDTCYLMQSDGTLWPLYIGITNKRAGSFLTSRSPLTRFPQSPRPESGKTPGHPFSLENRRKGISASSARPSWPTPRWWESHWRAWDHV